MFFPATKTELAQDAVATTVAMGTARVIRGQLTQHTTLDPTAFVARVGTVIAGEVIAYALKPRTDAAVVMTIQQAQRLKLKFRKKNDDSSE